MRVMLTLMHVIIRANNIHRMMVMFNLICLRQLLHHGTCIHAASIDAVGHQGSDEDEYDGTH